MLTFVTDSKLSTLERVISPLLAGSNLEVGYHIFKSYKPTLPTFEPGNTYLVMGEPALNLLAKAGYVPKNRTISSLREKPILVPDGYYIPVIQAFKLSTKITKVVEKTVLKKSGRKLREVFVNNGKYSTILITNAPGIDSTVYSKGFEVRWDIQLAVRLETTGSTEPKLGKYEWVEDFTALGKEVVAEYKKTGKPVAISADLETTGLDAFGDDSKIVSIAISHKEGYSAVKAFPKGDDTLTEQLFKQIDFLMNSKMVKVRGANFKFDMIWMEKRWGIKNFHSFSMDTTIVGSLLEENRSNSLNMHAKIASTIGGYDDLFSQTTDKSRMAEALVADPKGFLTYAGGDTDACLQVSNNFGKELYRDYPKLYNFYTKLMHPASIAFKQMEYRGMLVDRREYEALYDEVSQQVKENHRKALKLIGRAIGLAFDPNPDNWELSKAKLVSMFLFTHPAGLNLTPLRVTEKTQAPQITVDHMKELLQQPGAPAKLQEFCGCYFKWSKATKILSTYIEGFMKFIRDDGRFHPSYFLHRGDSGGTRTGRTSTTAPAYQCMIGNTQVLTTNGTHSLLSIVEGYEAGQSYQVMTHSGQWRKVIGVYRNGVRPVFKITTTSGHTITCTENHPVLTDKGYIVAKDLQVGYTVFTECFSGESYDEENVLNRAKIWKTDSNESSQYWTDNLALPMRLREDQECSCGESQIRQYDDLRMFVGRGQDETRSPQEVRYDENLSQLGRYEKQVQQPEQQRIQVLRSTWNQSMPEVGRLQEFPGRYGRDTGGVLNREEGRERPLSSGQLPMDSKGRAEFEQAKFKETKIVRIEPVGEEETYDLTIDKCHSFVANGIVVHNTIPKHDPTWAKKLRKVYIAPEGYLPVNCDYSQGELRIAACVSHDQAMIDAYLAGLDLHTATAANLNGYSVNNIPTEAWYALPKSEQKRMRTGAKAANFGLLYGMRVNKYVEYAQNTYGLTLTIEEGERDRENFFNTYKALLPWHEKMIAIAKENLQVESPLGRIRRVPLIHSPDFKIRSKEERVAINSVVQSALSDLGLLAAARIYQQYPELWFMGFTHDALSFYIKRDELHIWLPRIKSIMEDQTYLNEHFDWYPQVPFTVDFEVGEKSLGDMREIEDFETYIQEITP